MLNSTCKNFSSRFQLRSAPRHMRHCHLFIFHPASTRPVPSSFLLRPFLWWLPSFGCLLHFIDTFSFLFDFVLFNLTVHSVYALAPTLAYSHPNLLACTGPHTSYPHAHTQAYTQVCVERNWHVRGKMSEIIGREVGKHVRVPRR